MATKKNATKTTKDAKGRTPTPRADAGGLSCLEAAAVVLRDAKEPMRVRAIVDAMKSRGLWSSRAATPHATLYSAILREITAKKGKSRFKKTARGHFALNG